MKEKIVKLLQDSLLNLKKDELIPDNTDINIKVDRTKDKIHGDFATNIALILAGKLNRNARELADLIVKQLASVSYIEKMEIAGPGFINFFLKAENKYQVVSDIFLQRDKFGSCNLGNGQKVLLEFVSANPTGPLHVGHGRGAAFGSALATLLKFVGFEVDSEYYVNDSGRQMDILAVSVWLRYLELCGENVIFPKNGYQGDYVVAIAQELFAKYAKQYQHTWSKIVENISKDEGDGGDKEDHINDLIVKSQSLLGKEGFEVFHKYALDSVLDGIKGDLCDFGVDFDNWFSERSLMIDDSISKALDVLQKLGHTYLKDGALWFKSTAFGDEKDRVLVRKNGQNTYFAPDIAYHWNKYQRGYTRVIDAFGADHHGYVTRLRSAVRALGHAEEDRNVIIVQCATLYRNNERVQMSTRSRSFVTMKELQDEVGKEAARFFYLMRRPDQHMDFDLDLAKSESNDNPVYYVQYAHARIASVMRQLETRNLGLNIEQGLAALDLLNTSHELDLLTALSRFPDMIHASAQSCEPHQIVFYLRDLANLLHSYYNAVQLICEDVNLRSARICLLLAIRQVLKNGLDLLGVSSPESM